MESLAKLELREANEYFVRYREAHRLYVLFMGGSSISTAALPVLLLVHWLLGYGSIVRGAIAGVSMLFVGFSISVWWWLRVNGHFKQIQSRCLKLQRAGYFVYRRPNFLRNELGVCSEMPSSDLKILDFEHLTSWNLDYEMI